MRKKLCCMFPVFQGSGKVVIVNRYWLVYMQKQKSIGAIVVLAVDFLGLFHPRICQSSYPAVLLLHIHQTPSRL